MVSLFKSGSRIKVTNVTLNTANLVNNSDLEINSQNSFTQFCETSDEFCMNTKISYFDMTVLLKQIN